ncbi:30S ribosomal protein S12 methylthiotransferase RimO [Prolixibacter denitrificans]|uniref:Ribosomal protein uS12 methylthiotransferase RimO n=1 Tax=Prolixibacter denitrificans TaxID=1541063 RepID=A0A2P8CEJ1_9BACT|nr:30S ribosomal protein S12 methylthiotransferase RimO [Prolixibacter denitrificans]PSK83404.1 ribosomal protein S12 methylthiotransferase [Prolixibacter denitrificans]GET21716.1 ribosomal protein S12 methylthiotransferase RimO [Prolixibacter denitrificans]
MKKKVNVVTMGCSKNLVDSELFLNQLQHNGYDVVHDSNDTDARIVAVNTCGFILDAKEESVEAIMNFVDAKNKGMVDKLFVFGCLSARYRDELINEIPEVDGFYGKFEVKKMISDLKANYYMSLSNERYLTTPSHYAFLKISEGCDRTCSYCAIPRMTGKHISKPMEDIIEEATLLAKKGVKELLIIAQDLSFYGMDRYKKSMLDELLNKLSDIPGIEWIKLHYAYPAGFPYKILPVMREQKNMARYLDIALQHSSNHMLKIMRRNITREKTIELLNRIRKEVPGIHIRTTMLVGHPGETEEDFEDLKAFVREMRFERLGVFPYSFEEDTYAGENYKDDVPQEVKEARAAELMQIQQEIAAEITAEKVGTEMKVLIDRKDEDFYVGRTEFDSPEVDGEVYIDSQGKELEVGSFCQVEITHTNDYDLYGVVK